MCLGGFPGILVIQGLPAIHFIFLTHRGTSLPHSGDGMKVLRPGFAPREFMARVGSGCPRVLLLDYDGTLAPFRKDRDTALPFPGVKERVAALMRLPDSRVVLVTGRGARDLASVAGFDPMPEIWGSHGWERLWPDGRYEMAQIPDESAAGLHKAKEAIGPSLREWLEEKPAGFALHLRGLASAEAASVREWVGVEWEALTERCGLEILAFQGGLEIRVMGRNKATAVNTLREECGENACFAYLGDDLTDEDAFHAIHPWGLGVLVRADFRPTAASWWVTPPGELLHFMKFWENPNEITCREPG